MILICWTHLGKRWMESNVAGTSSQSHMFLDQYDSDTFSGKLIRKPNIEMIPLWFHIFTYVSHVIHQVAIFSPLCCGERTCTLRCSDIPSHLAILSSACLFCNSRKQAPKPCTTSLSQTAAVELWWTRFLEHRVQMVSKSQNLWSLERSFLGEFPRWRWTNLCQIKRS